MTMHSKKTIAALSFAVLLSGCGGGGGGNDDAPAFGVQDPKIEFLPLKPTLVSNPFSYPIEFGSPFFTQLNVRITGNNGSNPPENTIVSLRSSDLDVLTLSVPDRTSTTTVNEFTTRFGSICEGTSGGLATFFLHSDVNAGTATITGSVGNPLTSGTISGTGCTTSFDGGSRTISKNFDYSVSQSAPVSRFEVRPERTSVAVNSLSIAPSVGYPFATPVEITVRDPLNRLVNSVNVTATSASPEIALVSAPAAFATLTTTVSSPTVAGKATIYVHSLNRTGTARILFSSRDPSTGAGLAQEVTFSVGGGSTSAPSQLTITTDQRPLYSQGSGGNTTLPIAVRIVDDNGQSTPDAAPGVNNVFVEITNVEGEVLVGRNAAGQAVERASFNARTLAGIANLVLRSATRQGILQVKATADRADNNVDNGIQSPVSTFRPVVISDGKLFDLEITSPNINAIRINVVSADIVVTPEPGTPATPPNAVPGQPNASYSLTVSALGTDRQGNPVLPGTLIEFGLIDFPTSGFPLTGPGQFQIAGSDGDPLEGGTIFTAPTGAFLTAGGGVGPGDTLLVFGEESFGNRDLESSRKVARAVSQTQLDIQASTRFNLNDDSTGGVAVNRGSVLPYVIGRATFANIDNNKLTNDQGLATTKLNYPASAIGRSTAVWARGIGETPAGQVSPELITDVENFVYPGVVVSGVGGGGKINASPSSVTNGNTTLVRVCIADGLSNPIPGIIPTFSIEGGVGSVDEVPNTGRVRNATGLNGCTDVSVRVVSSGGGTGASAAKVVFSAAGLTADVTIIAASGGRLLAIPERLGGSGGTVILRLVDLQGNPRQGIQIFGTCAGSSGAASSGVNVFIPPTIVGLPGRTDVEGQTLASISASLDGRGAFSTGACSFTAATGEIAVVQLQGENECLQPFSGTRLGCPVPPPVAPVAFTIRLLDPNLAAYSTTAVPTVSVFANAGGILCSSASAQVSVPPGNCTGSVAPGTTVTLIANPTANFCRWTGGAECSGTATTISVSVTVAQTCSAVFSSTGPTGCPVR